MSLVAYGSSDESEEDSEEIQRVQNAVGGDSDKPARPRLNSVSNTSIGLGVEEKEHANRTDKPFRSLFQHLPEPRQHSVRLSCESTDRDELESHADIPVLAFLPVPQSSTNSFQVESNTHPDSSKKVGSGPVKITLPSLSQFNYDDEDEPKKKKLKPSKKGSGLFAILPAPKNVKSRETQQPLIPHVLTKKMSQTPTTSVSNHFNKVCRPSPRPKQSLLEADYESEDDQEDFFSLNSVSKLPEKELGTSTADQSLISRITQSSSVEHQNRTVSNEICIEEQHPFQSGILPSLANTSHFPGSSRKSSYNYKDEETDNYNFVAQPTIQEPSIAFASEDLQLDAEAMQRLCGRRSKKNQEPVEIIDVNGTEIMPDPSEWLVKQLSEEQPKMRSHSHKRNDGPTTQQRRKHQITYLAFQAKENELELKNQWSQNRMTRKQTQSKYGF